MNKNKAHSRAVIEAKCYSVSPNDAAEQAKGYTRQSLSNQPICTLPFQLPHVRRELGKFSSGTSRSMRNIAQGKLFGLSLPITPLSEQKAIAERASAVQSIRSQQSTVTAKAQGTFDAVLAQTFS